MEPSTGEDSARQPDLPELPGEPIEAVASDVEVDQSALASDPQYWTTERAWIVGGLVALGAPTHLTERLAETVPDDSTIRGIRQFLARFQKRAEQGTVVDTSIAWKPVPALRVVSTTSATVTAELASAETQSRGWKLRLTGLGLSRERTYEISTTLSTSVDQPSGVIVELLVPFRETVRAIVPDGGKEPFNVRFLEPYGDAGPTHLGSRTRPLSPQEDVDRSMLPGTRTPVGGASPYTDERSMTTRTTMTVSIGSHVSSITQQVFATFESKMTVEAKMELPPGSFEFAWTSRPFGIWLTTI